MIVFVVINHFELARVFSTREKAEGDVRRLAAVHWELMNAPAPKNFYSIKEEEVV